ncbi:uncharacterized protein LOC143282753 [Babylonia areolata]|uniref:uncharacterized protein LOC143282753 n=1 Tax=Babylonia areolata TaxID=304850 RepID=UPI003FCF0838
MAPSSLNYTTSNYTTTPPPNYTMSSSLNDTTSFSLNDTTSFSPNNTKSSSPDYITTLSPNNTKSSSPNTSSPNVPRTPLPNYPTTTSPNHPTSTSPNYTAVSPSEKAPHTQGAGGDSGDGNAAAIAAGVTVPVVLILLIAGIVYWYYRKKYPVRMIVGRDFAKFSNPAYSRRQSQPHTLVREDADTFFQQTQPSGPVTLVFGENGEEAKVCYINTAFQYDSQDADEDEVEKRFRQQKAYLFKKDDEGGSDVAYENVDENRADGARGKKKDRKPKVNGQVRRDEGHDNAAFSGDSDSEGNDAKDTSKKDKMDSESTSSDVSGASKKAGEALSPERRLSQQEIPEPEFQFQEGMTVRDFLQLVKEKRGLSEVQRARADTLTTFEFDVKKSARRRAQSAGDIWTSAVQALPPVSKEDLVLNSKAASSADEELQADSKASENVTVEIDVQRSADDDDETTQQEPHADLETEEDKGKVGENGMENSYVVVDETPASGSDETLSQADEHVNSSDLKRRDSSTSDSSFEKVSMQIGSLQSAGHGIVSHAAPPQQEEDADSSQDRETADSARFPDIAVDQDGDYVNVAIATKPSSASAHVDTFRSLEQSSVGELSDEGDYENIGSRTEVTYEPSEVSVKLDESYTTKTDDEDVDVPALQSISTPSDIAPAVENSHAESSETLEGLSLNRQTSGDGSEEGENVSPSSSLVVLDRNDVEDLVTGAPAFGDKLLTEEEDSDSTQHDDSTQHAEYVEQEDAPSFGPLDPDSSTRTQNRPSSVQILTSLTYSDQSSTSSNEGVEPKKDQSAGAGQKHEAHSVTQSGTLQSTSEDDDEESVPPRQTLPTELCLSSDTAQSSHVTIHPDSETMHTTAHGTRSSPQPSRPRGLAALRQHPDVTRSSGSDSGDEELTTEDIRQALEGCDDSDDDVHQGPQPPPQMDPGKTPVKITPPQMFVFSEEDDEDFDV